MNWLRKYFIPNKENDYTPHVFRERAVLVIGFFIVCVLGVSIGTRLIFLRTNLFSAIYPAVLVDLANNARQEHNEAPLTLNPLLEKAAKEKVADMVANGYFAHVSPEGKSPWYFISESGYRFVYAGENLAVDFTESADVNRAWLNSPGHRANILGAQFTEIGIATAEGIHKGRPTTFVVQMFGSPASIQEKNIQPEISVTESEISINTDVPISNSSIQDIQVLGEQTTDKELFIVAKNNTQVNESSERIIEQKPVATQYAPVATWALVYSPQFALKVLYVLIGIIVTALLLMIGIHINIQRPKNIMYAILLLMLLGIVVYIEYILLVAF